MTSQRLSCAAGLATMLAGAQVLVLVLLLAQVTAAVPASVPVVAAAATAGGWILATGGSGRIGRALSSIRQADPGDVWAAFGIATAVLGVALALLLGRTPRADASLARLAPVLGTILGVQASLAVGLFVYRLPSRGSAEPDQRRRGTFQRDAGTVRPWRGAHALIAAFVAVSVATFLGGLADVYPFSRFAMYSAAMTSPFHTDRIVFVGTRADGTTTELPPAASRQVLLRLGGWSPPTVEPGLRTMARRLGAKHAMAVVEVRRERQQVSPYPQPPGLTVVKSTTLYEVRLG